MMVQLESREKELVAWLAGEIDHHTAQPLREQVDATVERTNPRTLWLDFHDVTFMDSSGIAVILKAYRRMQHLNGTLLVCHVPGQARRVLDAAGVGRLVRIQ